MRVLNGNRRLAQEIYRSREEVNYFLQKLSMSKFQILFQLIYSQNQELEAKLVLA
jgi:hypothetical protein